MDNQIKKIDENQVRILQKLDTLQHLGNEHRILPNITRNRQRTGDSK